MKIYYVVVEAFSKKESLDEIQFITKVDGFLSFTPLWILFFFGRFCLESCLMYDQTQCSLLNGEPLLLAHLYKWEGEDFGQNTRVIKDTLWQHIENLENKIGTHWNFFRNMMGTHRDPKKMKNLSPPPITPHPQPPKKRWGPLNVCCTFPFAPCNFYFQNYWSTFLT